jgi:hypothetical protein
VPATALYGPAIIDDVEDWTPVAVAAVTGFTGVVGGFIGYLIARSQGHVERARITAENERLRIQYDLDRATERKTTYHEFIVTAYRGYLARMGVPPFTQVTFADWVKEYSIRGSAVELFGTEAVREAIGALEEVYSDVINATNWETPETSFPAAFDPLTPRWLPAYSAVVDAMRMDIGADRKSLSAPKA